MGLLAPGRDEKVGCGTWLVGGVLLVIAGVVAMVMGLFDAIF